MYDAPFDRNHQGNHIDVQSSPERIFRDHFHCPSAADRVSGSLGRLFFEVLYFDDVAVEALPAHLRMTCQVCSARFPMSVETNAPIGTICIPIEPLGIPMPPHGSRTVRVYVCQNSHSPRQPRPQKVLVVCGKRLIVAK
eukprot:scaffold2437_cov395-Prasinococcus_capsulatus_cf.AAC.3